MHVCGYKSGEGYCHAMATIYQSISAPLLDILLKSPNIMKYVIYYQII